MNNLLFFRPSLATRHAALETMRQARAMPPGPERGATRRFARALGDLAKTEAWLEGQTPKRRASAYELGIRAASSVSEAEVSDVYRGATRREPRSLFGET